MEEEIIIGCKVLSHCVPRQNQAHESGMQEVVRIVLP